MSETTAVLTPFVVGVAGGSGSGKTVLTRAMAATLGAERTAILAQDAYYRDRGHLPAEARAAVDYDHPDALDADLFHAHLRALRAGQLVVPPRYCYVTHRRLGPGEAIVPRDVVLVEGILLLHDPAVHALLDLRIFVDAPTELRLARRIARDTAERGRTRQAVLDQCHLTVLPAHARWVEPTKAAADLVLLNAGRLERAAEVAVAVIRTHLDRRARALPEVS